MASCARLRSVVLPAGRLFSTTTHRRLLQHVRSLQGFLPMLADQQPPISKRQFANVASLLASTRPRPRPVQGGRTYRITHADFAPHLKLAPDNGRSLQEKSGANSNSALHSEISAPPLESPKSQTATPDEPHIPVLLEEVLEQFAGRELGVFVDGTLGAAGHACAILDAHREVHTFIGLDVDPRAHSEAKARLEKVRAQESKEQLNVHLIRSNFESVQLVLKNLKQGFEKAGVDGMLLDLGVSSMQVDEAERGFSFLRDGPLDMRMNPGGAITAEQVVNDWSEDRLGKLIRDYGEERYWRSIARRIAEARSVSRIRTTGELVDIVGGPRPGRRKGGAPKGIHPATRTFQALRIAVNDELGVLERVLPQAIESLSPGGRLAVISFHSLEDRIVKRAFLAAAGRPYVEEDDGIAYSSSNLCTGKEVPTAVVKILTKKPIVTSKDEAKVNSRSRSAKLRVVEKLCFK